VVPKRFKSPKRSLGDLDAEAAGALIAAAADVALIVDGKGIIRDLAVGSEELARELDSAAWLGQSWIDTVTAETRSKVEALLTEAVVSRDVRWRQVNHPSSVGADVPILYSSVAAGKAGRIVALGRDLRVVAGLQQRLVDAQQSMERDYWRLRHAETRYRLLFQMASEPIVVLDASNQKVLEANPAADRLLGENGRTIVARPFPEGFDRDSTQAIHAMLAAVRSAGRGDEVRVRLADGKREFLASASLFRQESATLFLIRLSPTQGGILVSAIPKAKSELLRAVESAPDGFVLTDSDGRILSANRAFLDLAQLASEEQAQDESIDRWLGRPGVDLSVMTANLRQHGSLRLFSTTLRGEHGQSAQVEISAVAVVNGQRPHFGFTIRNIAARLPGDSRSGREVPRSVEQLTELVGRVSLKDLVREATDVIERLCIEAALELTGDNRASAAEMLGLSRQSLYVKLRRYGLGDLDADSSAK